MDLLKYYTILFAIKHLTDGRIDSRFIRPYTGFINMISNFNQLFLNWYIAKNKLLQEKDYDINGKIKIIFYIN